MLLITKIALTSRVTSINIELKLHNKQAQIGARG